MTMKTMTRDQDTDQHKFDNQVVLVRDIQAVIFCSIITNNASNNFCHSTSW